MKNLSGIVSCDIDIRKELEAAGVDVLIDERSEGTVPSSLYGQLGNWCFERAEDYWYATTDGKGFSEAIATALNGLWSAEIEAIGGYDLFHISTQRALTAFAHLIKAFSKE